MSTMQNMHDILPLSAVSAETQGLEILTDLGLAGLLAMLLALVIVIALVIRRYRQQPLRRLKRSLLAGTSPRTVAHQLARSLPQNAPQQPKLTALRFGASAPTEMQVLDILQSVKNGA